LAGCRENRYCRRLITPPTDDPNADWSGDLTGTPATSYVVSVYDKNLGTSQATAKTAGHLWTFTSVTGLTSNPTT